jgi:hypothetical protein
LAFGLGKEPSIGDASTAIAELGGKQDYGLKGLTDSIEKTIKRRVEGGLGGC